MILRTIKTLTVIALMTLASVPVSGQDMLARQAPIDRKMKAVDSVALQRLISNEQAQSPPVKFIPIGIISMHIVQIQKSLILSE